MEEQIGIMECLNMTVELLKGIMVPVAYAQEISRPLDQAVRQLTACIDALKEPEEKPEGGEENV